MVWVLVSLERWTYGGADVSVDECCCWPRAAGATSPPPCYPFSVDGGGSCDGAAGCRLIYIYGYHDEDEDDDEDGDDGNSRNLSKLQQSFIFFFFSFWGQRILLRKSKLMRFTADGGHRHIVALLGESTSFLDQLYRQKTQLLPDLWLL